MIKIKQRTPWVRTIIIAFYTLGFIIVGATIPCTNTKVVCYTVKGIMFGIVLILIYVLIWQIFNKRIIKVEGNKIIISNHLISRVKKVKHPTKLEIKSFSSEFKSEHGESFLQIYNLLIHKFVRLILFKNIYYSVLLIENGKSKRLIQDLTEQDAKNVLEFINEALEIR